VYNTSFGSSAPKVPGKDDVTGEPLTKRPDDNPVSRNTPLATSRHHHEPAEPDHSDVMSLQETFSKRLATFHESTSPLLHYFAERYPGSLHNLEGATSDEVKLAATFSYHHAPEADDLTLASAPPDNVIGIEKIWPNLQAIIDPYNIERKPRRLSQQEVATVRSEADDLQEGK
jgi:adenylate kinase